ncbi:MAG: acyl-CoA dehydrogenase [Desulfobacterales bacterium]|nr:acyl-CoA dehydrogenase [Desulfobacterales bacterium]
MDSDNNQAPRGLDPESREMVLDMIAQVEKRLLTREKILEYDRKEIFPEETIRALLGPEIGLQLLFVPEELGGMGGGARDCCAVTREVSKICLGIGTAFFAIQLGADPLLVGGTPSQKERWLGAIASGEALVAYGVTEPDAGSNLAALKTKAEPVMDETGAVTAYKINGAKQFISTGGYADIVTVLARTPEGPSFFVVEKGMEGFEAGKGEEKHGIRASNTSPLTFTDVVVPPENLIGGVPGKGLKQANKVFGYTRVMVAAMALGAGEAALDIVIPYAKERIQFGGPLSEKQGYTHKLVVPNAVKLAAASAYIDELALKLDSTDEELQVEGSIAKLFATEAANKTAEDAIQALGGYGYITEFGVEKIKRDVKITCIYEGTSEIQQNIISTFRWKKTRKTKGAFYKDILTEMTDLDASLPGAGCPVIGRCADALADVVNLAHENRLTRKQFIMFMLADMMTHVEVGASLARKAVRLSREGAPDAEKTRVMSAVFAEEVAQLFSRNIPRILMGAGVFDDGQVSDFMAAVSFHELLSGCRNILELMDAAADFIFER